MLDTGGYFLPGAMYDAGDVPSVQSHDPPPSTLSRQGGAMPRAASGRLLGRDGMVSDFREHLPLKPSTLRRIGGVLPLARRQPLFQRGTDAPFTLSGASSSSMGRLPCAATFGRGTSISYIDRIIRRSGAEPAPGDYSVTGQPRSFGSGRFTTSTRPIFASTPFDSGPGPSEYGPLPRRSGGAGGVSFGSIPQRKPLLFRTPGPKYEVRTQLSQLGGQKISNAKLPGEAELMIRRNVPGPGTYQSKSTLLGSGAPRFSESSAPTEIDRIIARSQRVPAPGAYHSTHLVESCRRLPSGSGKFSTAYPKSDLDWIELRSGQVPGPGAHSIKYPGESSNTAPRFTLSNTPSVIDKAILRAKDTPAPSQYVHAPTAKDWTLRKSQSASFILKSTAERFDRPPKQGGILHPRWREFPAVPGRPGQNSAPSHSMAPRFSPPRDRNMSMIGPGRIVQGAGSCGVQVLSQKSTAPAAVFGSGATDESKIPFSSPVNKPVPGPAKYDVEKAWKKRFTKQSGRGFEAQHRAKVARARVNLWKWRSTRNL